MNLFERQERRALTVSELTRRVKGLIEGELRSVWVEGELSNVTLARSGHLYAYLKDDRSVLRLVVWRSTVQRLRFPGINKSPSSLHPCRSSNWARWQSK